MKHTGSKTAFLAFPVLAFIWMVLTYAVNIPWLDDVDAFPDFLKNFLAANRFFEKWQLLIKPNNEHRILLTRLVNLLVYYTTGQLNLRWVIILANLFNIGYLALFYFEFKRQKIDWKYLIPVAFILLQPQYYLNSLWAISSLQYSPVVLIGLLGMYYMGKGSSVAFAWAIGITFFNSFTMSNGLFFWGAGAVLLLIHTRWTHLAIWVVSAILAFKAYFTNFNNSPNDAGIAYFKQHPSESFFGFFTHLGGIFENHLSPDIFSRSVPAFMVGFALCVLLLMIVFKQKPRNLLKKMQSLNPTFLGGVLFLLANALVIAILRPRFGFFVMIVGNYRIYPTLFLTLIYLLWIPSLSKNHIKWVLPFAVLFNIGSYLIYLPEVIDRYRENLSNAYNQENNHIGLGPIYGSAFAKYVNDAMDPLVAKGIFKYPKTILKQQQSTIQNPRFFEEKMKLDSTFQNGNIILSNPNLRNGWAKDNFHFLILKSPSETYTYFFRNSLKDFYFGGISFAIHHQLFKKDVYQVYLAKVDHGKLTVQKTNRKVSLGL